MNKAFSIKDSISSDLALRNSVPVFFNNFTKLSEKDIVIDFSGVISMSRSFAHEYLLNKEKITTKHVSETNVPQNIQQMFDIVKKSVKNQSFQLDPSKVITI